MEYKTNRFSLNEMQQNLRIGLTNLIREHVEKGMTREELKPVLDSLDLVLGDYRFKEERDEQQQFYDAVFNMKKKDDK